MGGRLRQWLTIGCSLPVLQPHSTPAHQRSAASLIDLSPPIASESSRHVRRRSFRRSLIAHADSDCLSQTAQGPADGIRQGRIYAGEREGQLSEQGNGHSHATLTTAAAAGSGDRHSDRQAAAARIAAYAVSSDSAPRRRAPPTGCCTAASELLLAPVVDLTHRMLCCCWCVSGRRRSVVTSIRRCLPPLPRSVSSRNCRSNCSVRTRRRSTCCRMWCRPRSRRADDSVSVHSRLAADCTPHGVALPKSCLTCVIYLLLFAPSAASCSVMEVQERHTVPDPAPAAAKR